MTVLSPGRVAALERAAFRLPAAGASHPQATYLCGHSLGPMPRTALASVAGELERWSTLAVRGHFVGEPCWVEVTEPLRDPLGKLVGARPDEVVAMNGLSVNLHLMLSSFYRPRGDRQRILVAANAFPSDRLAVASQCSLHGRDPLDCVVTVPAGQNSELSLTEVTLRAINRHGAQLALVWLDAVDFLTGEVLDVGAIARAAHAVGATVGFDLAHAIGNVPLALSEAEVDFAVWCSYKYLNAGPGGLGGAYVHRRHHGENLPRLRGWWGMDPADRFAWHPDRQRSAPSAAAWQLSNPPVLEAAVLRASLAVFDRHSMPALRAQGLRLQQAVRQAIASLRGPRLDILTPSDPERHASMLSLRIAGDAASTIEHALLQQGVVADVRGDILRVAFCPLYNDDTDVTAFATALERCL